jgi:hypothetical protein
MRAAPRFSADFASALREADGFPSRDGPEWSSVHFTRRVQKR